MFRDIYEFSGLKRKQVAEEQEEYFFNKDDDEELDSQDEDEEPQPQPTATSTTETTPTEDAAGLYVIRYETILGDFQIDNLLIRWPTPDAHVDMVYAQNK